MTGNSTDEVAEREEQYESRSESIQYAIDVLSQYEQSELDEYGAKAEIAREHDVDQHRIHYVLRHYQELVDWRRNANRDPLDPDAVKQAYDDETMQALAENKPVPDGAGGVTVEIELGLDEVFRAVKLLPGDLGLKVYVQTLQAEGIPRSELRRILED